MSDSALPAADREAWLRAVADFEAAQRVNADRPEARATLAGFYVQRGRLDDAETEYRAAVRLNPQFTPAAIGLANLYRQRGDNGKALETLKPPPSRRPATAASTTRSGWNSCAENATTTRSPS